MEEEEVVVGYNPVAGGGDHDEVAKVLSDKDVISATKSGLLVCYGSMNEVMENVRTTLNVYLRNGD